jgi:2-aminoadipate transaminase
MDALMGVLEARGIHATGEELLVTSGSQQGLDLVARVLIDPGDVVLVELPTFTGAIAAFANVHADLQGVPQTDGGLDLEQLDAVWQTQQRAAKTVKLLYLIPNFQNPTGRLLDVAARRRVLEWADRRDVLILEDDPYGSLYFDEGTADATRALRADDTSGRVIYLSSFSKTLAPGFRVGWMVAPALICDRCETAKQSVDLTSGILDQRIVYEAVRQGVVERLAPRLRELYRRKRDAMEGALRNRLGDAVQWSTPKGGFFLWVTLPPGRIDTDVFDRAMAAGVIFVIGSAFFVDGTGHECIRLSFSAPDLDAIGIGVDRLASALAS